MLGQHPDVMLAGGLQGMRAQAEKAYLSGGHLSLTLLRNDAKGDAKTRILDELHDVRMWHADDRLAVDC